MRNEKKEKQDAILSLRYYVVISFFLMWIGVILVWLDSVPFEYIYTEMAVVSLGFLLFHKFSRSLGFCLMHRLLIHYAYLITLCIWWRRYFGFGEYLDTFRLICIIIGLVLFFGLIINYYCNDRKGRAD